MIEASGVSYAYDGATVLDGVSFSVSEGEKVVLLGCNGSGKSTLLKLLNGLLTPTRGRCLFRGRELDRSALTERDFVRAFRRECVLLFQNPDAMLFNPTVHDEIAFGPRQLGLDDVDGRVRRWAAALEVDGLLKKLPQHLSSGEKQKVCLAALLALEPAVLLLDEPTASLDPRSTGWLVDFLQDLEQTILVTTHNLSMAPELGDRALLLSEEHTLIHDGGIAELLRDKEKLRAANLVHEHRHRHDGLEHRHFHSHDWD